VTHPLVRARTVVVATLAAWLGSASILGCALLEGEQSVQLRRACSDWSPSVQTALLAARVRLGGPAQVYVDGWTCGQVAGGPLVRIVFLRFHGVPADVKRAVVPVIFEDGRLVGDGWQLLQRQPDRYGTSIDVRDWGPPQWRVPPGWVVRRIIPDAI
jgi:hypothetical protein